MLVSLEFRRLSSLASAQVVDLKSRYMSARCSAAVRSANRSAELRSSRHPRQRPPTRFENRLRRSCSRWGALDRARTTPGAWVAPLIGALSPFGTEAPPATAVLFTHRRTASSSRLPGAASGRPCGRRQIRDRWPSETGARRARATPGIPEEPWHDGLEAPEALARSLM
jgi:hypothetical protein